MTKQALEAELARVRVADALDEKLRELEGPAEHDRRLNAQRQRRYRERHRFAPKVGD
jgi:hypothetical protein